MIIFFSAARLHDTGKLPSPICIKKPAKALVLSMPRWVLIVQLLCPVRVPEALAGAATATEQPCAATELER